jgi:hypothetical protein
MPLKDRHLAAAKKLGTAGVFSRARQAWHQMLARPGGVLRRWQQDGAFF